MYLGGGLFVDKGFVGCMRRITIDGQYKVKVLHFTYYILYFALYMNLHYIKYMRDIHFIKNNPTTSAQNYSSNFVKNKEDNFSFFTFFHFLHFLKYVKRFLKIFNADFSNFPCHSF